MAKTEIVAGATSQSVNVFIQDSSSTTGAGLSGLVYNTSGLIAYYTFTGANAAATAITLATLAAVGSAFSSGGFKEIDSTNMKGLYRLDIPNAALAASKGRLVTIQMGGATNMAPMVLEITLTGWDNQDGVHGGLTALPNTAVTTNASLLTSGTGTDQLSVTSGRIDIGKALGTAVTLDANNVLNVSAKYLAGTALTGRDIGASVLLSSGSGTGQVLLSSGHISNVDTLTTYTGNTVQTGDAYARLGAPAGASTAADIAAVKSDTGAIKTATNTGVAPGAAGGLFIAGTNAATSITTGLTAHIIGTVDTLTTYTGNTVQTGDAYARLGAPAGASTAADIAAVKASFPTNSSALGITAGGKISEVALVDTLTTYTGDTPQTGDVYAAVHGAAAELSAVPAANANIIDKIRWLFLLGRNKVTTTATTTTAYADDGSTSVATSTVSDDGTTFTRGKLT